MHNRLITKTNHLLERAFPEQHLFLRSEDGTRFIRLSPLTQAIGWTGSAAFFAWSIIATAVLLMDSIGSGNLRDQAQRDKQLYELRVQTLSDERDARSSEAIAAQERFNLALSQISVMQSELLASEERRRELETGIGVIQSTLRRTIGERDLAKGSLEDVLAEARENAENALTGATAAADNATLTFMTEELTRTAAERDKVAANAAEAERFAQDMVYEARLREERNDQIFRQLEDAVSISLEPLDKMFAKSGMSVDSILGQIRRGYSGQGGPLTPLILSTSGGAPDPDTERANRILGELDRMNLYRIAAQKMPFGMPVKSGFRFTSGFGKRWGRMHNGTDFAAPIGTPVYAPADGVVVHAGWSSGYGRLIKIQHEFGVETRYAHLSRMTVQKGQRVSRGERIGDIGNSGRSTGPHLHYEVRVGGRPINPMIYIKAARDVF
ncbi:Murein DD-endopeptidase MepM and murein hydrolase activator NlpD, contain LysM domain [Aliiroseovarius halocynthiae]|uniref:Peptidoglycan DD-metalloendopeptidase family protein n=1 Tax=Aliiroseovarius halocynthiae TaxID=985055 RepID=A0A545SWL7_9RHOB|nr:M23 family metallopeptidase [Aliiroseovarius halocynthiae]TQV69357.1 peptidoglycan DD-metalloendopeptidase family protein [Aliiroseovarius halocynthiae]SMR72485.1 Murein DD-endopeptidase MepM and murein hydrolase activator NlpD, contain LysM domain [Aliiroseovarius halocynthiae]